MPPLLPSKKVAVEDIPEENPLARLYIAVMAILTVAVIFYRALYNVGIQQSAALFIGAPALIGVLIALTPKPKSNTGTILRVITLALLLSGPILAEGFICILMAAPLFWGVGLVIGLIADSRAKKRNEASQSRLRLVICLPLFVLMSLEGVTPELSFSRNEVVSGSRVIPVAASEVEKALEREPRFQIRPAGVLGIGFPVPLSGSGSALSVGSRRTVHFSGGEGRPPGDLELEVAERREGYVRFAALTDSSHLTHWLRWTGSEVRWVAKGPTETEVTWTIHFERGLDPAWYFGLPERWVVARCVDYLITTCATP